MEVYSVLAWHDYYPSSDNCRGLYKSLHDAIAKKEELEKAGDVDHVEIKVKKVN
jgi:uncharacterized protein YjaG (DUF416 family)